jgi:hypothetical protein
LAEAFNGASKLLVLVAELRDPLMRQLEAALEGLEAGPAGRGGASRPSRRCMAQLLDPLASFGLGVDPRPRHRGVLRELRCYSPFESHHMSV